MVLYCGVTKYCCMIELTILLLIIAFTLTVLRIVIKKKELCWLCFVTSIMSVCAVLVDDTLTGNDILIALAPAIFLTFMSVVALIHDGRW